MPEPNRRQGWQTLAISRTAVAAAIALVAGIGGWATLAEIDGAVLGQGEVRIASHRQTVQHRFGGTVEGILARDNDFVNAGDILLRLNDTRAKAAHAIALRRLDSGEALLSRLSAERDETEKPAYPTRLLERAAAEPAVARLLANETALLQARNRSFAEQYAGLQNRIVQTQQEVAGLERQRIATEKQQTLITAKLNAQTTLIDLQLAPRAAATDHRLELATIERDLAALDSDAARARTRIAETQIAIAQLEAARIESLATQIRETEATIPDLHDELRTIEDELASINVIAPVSGIVHASSVHTAGAVLTAAEPVLSIVPQNTALIIEARIATTDIDAVPIGSNATVRLPAFNMRTTPELAGTVSKVAPDRTLDEESNIAHYIIEIAVEQRELARLEDRELLPGMPTEILVPTSGRTPLSYLMKPITDHLSHAWRED